MQNVAITKHVELDSTGQPVQVPYLEIDGRKVFGPLTPDEVAHLAAYLKPAGRYTEEAP